MSLESINLPVLVAVITLIGGMAGYFVKYFLDKKSEFSSRNAEIKREVYQKYVDFVISFFDGSQQQNQDKVKKTLYGIYRQLILYGSPRVINSMGDLMHYFYKNSDNENRNFAKTLPLMTGVFQAMRKDIGLSNRGLGVKGKKLMRVMINDYDEKIGFKRHFQKKEIK